MNLLDNEHEWAKALRQLDVKCSRPRKSEGARYMSDDRLLENPQAFVALVSHQTSQPWLQKTRLDAPLLMTRALRAVRRLALAQKRWIASLTEQSGAGKPS